jgi:hypothetical protein
MRYTNKIFGFFLLLIYAFGGLSCQNQPAANNSNSTPAANTATAPAVKAQSPTEAYKMLYAAVKAKDTNAIKQFMSKSSMGLAQVNAERQKISIEKSLENGLVAPTLSDTLTEIRDERVKGNIGAIEVFNQKDNRWEELPFILEDGGWKLAVGDIFANTFDPNQTLPKGKGQMEISNKAMPLPSNVTKLPEMTDNSNKNAKIPSDAPKSVEVPKEKKP